MDLVARSADLKKDLVAFAQRPRLERELRRALDDYFGPVVVGEDEDLANFLDFFILQRRMTSGRTVVEQFVVERRDLSEPERTLLLGWRDVVEGIFEVERRDGDALIATGLVDDLTYRIRANVGPGVFKRMPGGSFLVTRLVPVGDEWLISGASRVIPKAARADAYLAAGRLATQRPDLVFRNPDKVAQGWDLQRRDREHFLAFFGSDLVILPGADLAGRMREFSGFRLQRVLDTLDPETRGARKPRATEPGGLFELPADLTEAETVAVVYDEVEGMSFYANFGAVEATFADPQLASVKRHRRAVLGYLKDDSISPLPFRRLADRDPERASQVFQKLLKRPAFSWERDGEALLRRYKRSYYDNPALPSVTPVSDKLAEQMTAAPARRGGLFRRATAGR